MVKTNEGICNTSVAERERVMTNLALDLLTTKGECTSSANRCEYSCEYGEETGPRVKGTVFLFCVE